MDITPSVVQRCGDLYRLLASQLEREMASREKERDTAPELVAYALLQCFSHASHQSGHGRMVNIPYGP